MSGEPRVKVEALEAFCVAAMLKAGMPAADARMVAEVLVTTDTWGVSTHGTKQLRPLLKNFRDGVRRNNVPMQQIAARLSDAEIKALADFAEGLRR